MRNESNFLPIEDYGLIGNMHTTALISKKGSIDYMPFPRFDSDTVFTSILDKKKGGFFSVNTIEQDTNYKQIYLPDTAILITRFFTDNGIAELIDFMPPFQKNEGFILIRKLKIIKGENIFKIEMRPRFRNGKTGIESEKKEDYYLIRSEESDENSFNFYSDIELKHGDDGNLVSTVTLSPKEEINFLIAENTLDPEEVSSGELQIYTDRSFKDTIAFWHEWMNKSTYRGRWQDIVNRSAITLKLLSSKKYGSTIAAATFGLPENIGGDRNWDYRYTWIRDSAFTMYSFLRLGYNDEARDFMNWIERRTHEIESAGDLNLMYRVDGSTDLKERKLSHLQGYKNSKPVRVGNDAFKQFQLDIYGELIDTIYIFNKNAEPISYKFWLGLVKFIDYVADNWKEKDKGIWEVRNDIREFLISKVMSWVALDRGILIAEDRSFPAPIEKWRKTRDDIFNDVFHNYWNPDKEAFVQYRNADSLDASALLMPLVRMLSPTEPRWISTLKAIEKELITDSMVYRYKSGEGAGDGFSDTEGTFSMCSFWYIECLARNGELDKATVHFEKMLGYANQLGLFSEQISLKGELLGNFPQAFTHLALISSAYQLKMLSEHGSMLKKQRK